MLRDHDSAFTKVSQSGFDVPLYLVVFDAQGGLRSPQQRDALVDAVRRGVVRDVHVYAHGWNNVFDAAVQRYTAFFGNYLDQRKSFDGAPPCTDRERTAFAGVIWPSTALVTPEEEAPRIGATPPRPGALDDETLQAADDVALALGVEPQAIRRYLDRPVLEGSDAAAFAEDILPLLGASDEVASRRPTTLGESLRVLSKLGAPADPAETAFADDQPPAGINIFNSVPVGENARIGGSLPSVSLDPRAVVRALSVYVMKDRARTVGADGVGPELIGPLLAARADANVHLIGHSFGSAVMLSAICANDLGRRVCSTLLLEPAVSWLCFASDVGNGVPGGYRAAPDRSERPILTTHSALDQELTHYYRLALLRKSDVGDPLAGAFDPFERFKPLGGYGPSPERLDWPHHETKLAPAKTAYARPPSGARIISFDGSCDTITSHGDVDNAHTAWLHAANVDGACFAS
jgi:pimeloyl-ACP methyl ester carboxylesterase